MTDVDAVLARLSEFYTLEEAEIWLHARHFLLGGERPIDLINEGREREVWDVIEQLESGTYT